MKTNLLVAAAAACTAFAAPVYAQQGQTTETTTTTEVAATPTRGAKPHVEVVSRGADGLPDVVNIDGQTYKVCKDEVQDSCINPRTAGLNFGARDLQYWPGRPASEISTPLPATPPATAAADQASTLSG